jgi:hypothetical protein
MADGRWLNRIAWWVLALGMLGCTHDAGDGALAEGTDAGDEVLAPDREAGHERLVSGILVRTEAEDTYNEPFVPVPEAHVVIGLDFFLPLASEVTEVVAEQDLPVQALPFEFELTGDPEVTFARSGSGQYQLRVRIFNHAGRRLAVGDMINEIPWPIRGVESDLRIEVSGLEDCWSAQAGWSCIGS